MENFKNMQELMKHLISGGAITNMDDSCKNCWVSLYKGNLHYPDKEHPIEQIGHPTSWKPVPIEWITNAVHEKTKKLKHE